MDAIIASLQVLASVMSRDDYVHFNPIAANKELPFAPLNTCNGLIQGKLPALPITVHASNIDDPLMRIGAVGFVDTFDLMPCGHNNTSPLVCLRSLYLCQRPIALFFGSVRMPSYLLHQSRHPD